MQNALVTSHPGACTTSNEGLYHRVREGQVYEKFFER